MNIVPSFADKLAYYLKLTKKSHYRVADEIGVQPIMIRNWLSGKNKARKSCEKMLDRLIADAEGKQ